MRKFVYLDNNATTKPDRRVMRAMKIALGKCYGNPSSLYMAAHRSKELLENSRAAVAVTIGAESEEITFTGSASEANNHVLVSLFDMFFPRKKRIVSTPIEHPSVMNTLSYLESRGAVISYIPVDSSGMVDMRAYEELLDDDVIVACGMFANNETGAVQDVSRMTASAHEKGVLFMSDCVQALGKIPVDVRTLGVDYATFSAHKIHGPKGCGALYVRKGSPIAPFIHGGHQEAGLRAGTESIHNIAGFAAASVRCAYLCGKAPSISRLRTMMIDGLKRIFPEMTTHTPVDSSLPNTASVTFTGYPNSVIIAVLDYYGIAVSAGSACSTPENRASHVLAAIGLSEHEARETIRFSLGDDTSKRDIIHLLKVMRTFRDGKTPDVEMIGPAFLDERMIRDDRVCLLDVRFWYDRRAIRTFTGAIEASFFAFPRYVKKIPKNKKIIVICQGGFYSPMIAYYLKRKGFGEVGFLVGGMEGWKAAYPELYEKMTI